MLYFNPIRDILVIGIGQWADADIDISVRSNRIIQEADWIHSTGSDIECRVLDSREKSSSNLVKSDVLNEIDVDKIIIEHLEWRNRNLILLLLLRLFAFVQKAKCDRHRTVDIIRKFNPKSSLGNFLDFDFTFC